MTVATKNTLRFQDFKRHLKRARRVLLSTHLLPDGDGLGAQYAIFHYLTALGKECYVVNPDPTPERYHFLNLPNHFTYPNFPAEAFKEPWDLWIIVDTDEPKRLSHVWNEFVFKCQKIIFIDHHNRSSDQPVRYPSHVRLLADENSSSIGELLFLLFNELKLTPLNKEIATGLYVSIMTDTNSFRYAKTSPQAHRVAADLLEFGIPPDEIYQAIYSSKQLSHVQLLGISLQNTKTDAKGKIAWMELDRPTRIKHHASPDDTQSFLNLLLLLREAEVVCLFREEDDGRVRVSIRSKGKFSILEVAESLGGGGHLFACGLVLPVSMRDAVEIVIRELKTQLPLLTNPLT